MLTGVNIKLPARFFRSWRCKIVPYRIEGKEDLPALNFEEGAKSSKMETLNVFIVDDNKMMAGSLRKYLENRFGNKINVSLFFSGESCLERIHNRTHLVILDYFLEKDRNGLDILRTIKRKFPRTRVIMHTCNDDAGTVIQAMNEGAAGYIIKDRSSWNKIRSFVAETVTQPLEILVEELGVTKFVIIFLSVFTAMGGTVMIMLKLMQNM